MAKATTATAIKVPMTFKKSTPGTYVYEADQPDAEITTLYIRKFAMEDGAKKTITVLVD